LRYISIGGIDKQMRLKSNNAKPVATSTGKDIGKVDNIED
jgi:sporulation protein YlmC with PRC-barrel domain